MLIGPRALIVENQQWPLVTESTEVSHISKHNLSCVNTTYVVGNHSSATARKEKYGTRHENHPSGRH